MPAGSVQQQRFNLQSRENSQELHDKLTDILERFEETRRAIKDNVKMLEGISDSTSAIGSPVYSPSNYNHMSNGILDSSYPQSSLHKHRSRSRSYTRLSSMDQSGTGTSIGLRTMSSVDSGVMLTLTSCSEAGTQSRSRSFDSWIDSASPFDTLDIDDESEKRGVQRRTPLSLRYQLTERQPSITFEQSGSEHDQQRDSDEEDESSDESVEDEDEDVFTSSRSHSEEEYEHQMGDQSEEEESEQHDQSSNTDESGSDSYDEQRWETQEHSIIFTEEDIYHILSPMSPLSQRSNLSQPSQRPAQLSSPLSNSTTTEKTSHHSSIVITEGDNSNTEEGTVFVPQTCIVLPAMGRVKGRPTLLPLTSRPLTSPHRQKYDGVQEWREKDRISIYHTDIEEEHPQLNNSRVIFSPIPEESPSELTPVLAPRQRRIPEHISTGYKHSPLISRSHSNDDEQRLQRSPVKSVQVVAQVHHNPAFNTYTVEHRNTHGLLPAVRENELSSPIQQTDKVSRKPRKLRRRRKKQPPSQSSLQHMALASTTSSATSSVMSSSNIQSQSRSDADLSLGSYHNAIHKHAIPLPPVLAQSTPLRQSGGGDNHNSASSYSSSPSYYDLVYTTSSEDSSDTEYDYQVSLQKLSRTPYNTSKHINHGRKLPVITDTQHRNNNVSQPPVLKKISKEKMTPTKKSDEHKSHLFTKNSSCTPKVSSSHRKLMKTKSDEASNSLLRYFRFPSPPRHSTDNSDSASTDLNKASKRSKVAVCADYEAVHDRMRRGRQQNHVTSSSSASSSTSSNLSSTDTASEIAYPDLPKQHRPHHQLLQQALKLSGESGVEINQQQPSISTETCRQPTQAAVHDRPFTLHVKEDKADERTGCASIFDLLFRRNKKNNTEQHNKVNSKLTLDLAGGEVRIRSNSAPTTPSNGGVAYITLPPGSQANTQHKQRRISCVDDSPIIRLHTPPPTPHHKEPSLLSVSTTSNKQLHTQRIPSHQNLATHQPLLSQPHPRYYSSADHHIDHINTGPHHLTHGQEPYYIVPLAAPPIAHNRGYVVQDYPDYRYRKAHPYPDRVIPLENRGYYNSAYMYSPEDRLRNHRVIPQAVNPVSFNGEISPSCEREM